MIAGQVGRHLFEDRRGLELNGALVLADVGVVAFLITAQRYDNP